MNGNLSLTVCAFGLHLVSACNQEPATTEAEHTTAKASGPAHVMIAQNPLGIILTDDHGRAFYLFVADTGTTSTCAGTCATKWPPLTTAGAPVAGPGVNAAMLSTTPRTDGTTQLTYNGHPLYYYDDDDGPGTTKGQVRTATGRTGTY